MDYFIILKKSNNGEILDKTMNPSLNHLFCQKQQNDSDNCIRYLGTSHGFGTPSEQAGRKERGQTFVLRF